RPILRGRTCGNETRQHAPRRTIYSPDQQRPQQGTELCPVKPATALFGGGARSLESQPDQPSARSAATRAAGVGARDGVVAVAVEHIGVNPSCASLEAGRRRES